MGDTKPSNKILLKTKHTKSSIRSYGVGVNPVATCYIVGWIISNYITYNKKESPSETLV